MLTNLNEALRRLRTCHCKTQKQLAQALGISKSYLSEIESGKKTPTLELLNRYAGIFKIPASSIAYLAENLGKPESELPEMSPKVQALLDFAAACT